MVGRHLSPIGGHGMRLAPPRQDNYDMDYHQRDRIMKRQFRKPSLENIVPRRRSMTPPKKRRMMDSPVRYRSPSLSPHRSFSPQQQQHYQQQQQHRPPMVDPRPSRGGGRGRTMGRVYSPPPPVRVDQQQQQPIRRPRPVSPAPRQRQTDGRPDTRESMRGSERDEAFYGPWGTRIFRSDLKKITVDIKRHVPKEKRSSSPIIRRIISPDDIHLYRRSGEGSRPLFSRPELLAAVNRRFDDPTMATAEPRVVAIIRDPPGSAGDVGNGSSRGGGAGGGRVYSPEPQQRAGPSMVEHGNRSDRAHRQVAKLEQMEVAIDRKLDQIQRYEQKYKESVRDDKFGLDMTDDRKAIDRNVRDRLGPKRAFKEGAGYQQSRKNLPDFSQRPNKPPVWGQDDRNGANMMQHDGGFQGRGRGGFRGRGGRGRGRGGYQTEPNWQHDKFETGF